MLSLFCITGVRSLFPMCYIGCPVTPKFSCRRFFRRAADRSRRDSPYKERNSENLQISPVPMEAGGRKKKKPYYNS